MNYLAHLLVCDGRPESLVGSILGDFARGLDLNALPAGIRNAVELHFRVDAFTDEHPVVRVSKRRIALPHRRYAGVLVDMFYDHFLARHWECYCDVSLTAFTANAYAAFLEKEAHLPDRMVRVCRAMAAGDWLGSYARLDAIDTALQRMSGRIRRANELGTGVTALVASYEQLEADFHQFFPDLQTFARGMPTSSRYHDDGVGGSLVERRAVQ